MQPFLQCIWQLNEKQFTPLALNFHNHITLTFQVPHFKLSKAHNLRHLPSSRVHFSPHPCRDGCSKGRSGTAVPLCQAQNILLCVKKSASEPDTLIHADDAFTYARGAPLSTEGALTLSEAYFSTVRATQACSQSEYDTCSGQSRLLPHQGCAFVLQPHTARRRLHFTSSLPPSYQMHLPLTMGTLQ